MFWRRAKPRGLENQQQAPAAKPRLGELLLEQGLVTQAQLDLALKQQARSHRFLGEILLEMGAINKLTLTRALELQYKRSGESAEESERGAR